MEPCGIFDSEESKILNRLVEKRMEEIQQKSFCILTSADKDRIREDIKTEIFLRTGKIV